MTSQQEAILARLQSNSSLEELELEVLGGRTVITGLETHSPLVTGTIEHECQEFETTIGNTHLNDVHWKDIHFIKCDLSDVKFFGGSFSNCRFERCKCQRMGLWDFKISESSFIGCNMRNSAPGGINSQEKVKKPNAYIGVTFDKCDLRSSAHSCESYRSCLFRNCQLRNVQFSGAIFEDCTFEGRLDGVEFRAFDISCNDMPSNRLLRCDFRKAELLHCNFIHIGMDPSMFPPSGDWIVLPNGPTDFSRWLVHFQKDNFVIKYLMELSGSPTMVSRSYLVEAGLTAEEIQFFVDLGKKGY